MTEKPDVTTWGEYVSSAADDDEMFDRLSEFASAMADETRRVIRQSDELNADEFDVSEDSKSVDVTADGWEMDKDDTVRVRDALRAEGVGDESVDVYCDPMEEDGSPAPLPNKPGMDYEYSVSILLKRVVPGE